MFGRTGAASTGRGRRHVRRRPPARAGCGTGRSTSPGDPRRRVDPPLVLQGRRSPGPVIRQWHWCYRFSIAAHPDPVYHAGCGTTPASGSATAATPSVPQMFANDPDLVRHATVSDVLHLGRAAELLLRWHVTPGSAAADDGDSAASPSPSPPPALVRRVIPPVGTTPQRPDQCVLRAASGRRDNWLRQSLDHVYHCDDVTSWNVPRRAAARWPPRGRSPGEQRIVDDGDHWRGAVRGRAGVRHDARRRPAVPSPSGDDGDVVGGPTGRRRRRRHPRPSSTTTACSSNPTATGAWNLDGHPGRQGHRESPGSTVTADNGAHTATVEFSLRVGPEGADPDPAVTTTVTEGLSIRRHSLLLDDEDLR